MSTDLLERREAAKAEQRKQSLLDYRELLKRIDNAQDGDDELLDRCMRDLGISDTDVKADRDALREVEIAEGYIVEPEAMERWIEAARINEAKAAEEWRAMLIDMLKMLPVESLANTYVTLLPMLPLSDPAFVLLRDRERRLTAMASRFGEELRTRARRSDESRVKATYYRQHAPRVFGPIEQF